jgi:hypothetical protein
MESKTRHHLSTQNLPSRIERFPHQIPAAKRQQVEGILVKFECGAIVLQDVNEDRPSLLYAAGHAGFAPVRGRSVSSMMKVHLLLNFFAVERRDFKLAGFFYVSGSEWVRSVKREISFFSKDASNAPFNPPSWSRSPWRWERSSWG